MPKVSESQQFADRLRSALESAGVRASPTLVANAFNLRYHGRSITPHTARNWLLGKVMPTQDKLRVLAEWLQVSPYELRFGRAPGKMVDRYLSLSQEERKTVRDVVSAFVRARAAENLPQ